MLDAFVVFTRGGLVLYTFTLAPLTGDPLGDLIRTCLLEERGGEESFGSGPYACKWCFHNGASLVFVAVYQRSLALSYVDGLLERVKERFVSGVYSPERRDYSAFDSEFKTLLAAAEAKGGDGKRSTPVPLQPPKPRARDGSAEQAQSIGSPPPGDDALATPGGRDGTGAFDVSSLSKLSLSRGKKPGAGSSGKPTPATDQSTGKSGKKGRVWDSPGSAAGSAGAAQLDFSSPVPGAGAASPSSNATSTPLALGKSAMDEEEEEADYGDETDDESEAVDTGDGPSSSGKGGAGVSKSKRTGWFSSALKSTAVTSLLGKAALEASDLQPVLDGLKRNLLNKNVASGIADALCDSVQASLVGQRLAGFAGLRRTVAAAMEQALTRILTPTRNVDILRDVASCSTRDRPYVIVFVGVNGVGKSTSLSKIAYWLSSNGKKVMIAACDTFRSGAVEQLRTHCTRLGVPLFEKGYAKDPAGVASEAIRAAAKDGCDVVLVDTAGRMQDNEPLMRSLAKLIHTNSPDLVLFVGEALVGNDAVDQLSKFNARLADLSAEGGARRPIDGIVLTKFDTIDDKVGAALSMAYTSGAPIMFVGTGQTYTDLKRFNPRTVVRSLLS